LTLQSIAEQTYSNHKIVAWDGGSKDGTIEELKRWIPSRINGVVIADQPMRIGPSRAAMLSMADTELCAVLDGDDLSLPQRLERQVEFMVEHPEIGVLGTQSQFIDANGNPVSGWHYYTDDAPMRWSARWRCPFLHSSVMLRRNVVLEAGNYRDFVWEDSDMWLRLSSTTEFHNLPEVLVQYRHQPTSTTGAITSFVPTARQVAELNVDILFPGLPDTTRAMQLWHATHPDQLDVPSSLAHSKQLKSAAVLLARQTGKPENYFTETELFRSQQYFLRNRLFERAHLMPLVRLRHRLAKAAGRG
jgi:glycosyltransferase involved in cell wall biosynthesis